MILMLKASSLSCRLTEVSVKKIVGDLVHTTDEIGRMNDGYIRYFPHNERAKARNWIVQAHNRLEGTQITKENIREIKDKEISDAERKTGELRKIEKRRKHRTLRGEAGKGL